MLDGFDREFSQGPLENKADFEPEAGMKLFRKSPDGMPSRRNSDYAHVINGGGQHWAYVEESQQAQARTPEEEAAHKLQLRDQTRYQHGGQELSDEEGQNWAQNWRQRYAYNSRAQKVADPQAGWDKPKVGKFRSAMSWLGNKLTFGLLGGKDYRARQEALKQREGMVKDAFTQRQVRYDEYEHDLNNPEAYDHELVRRNVGNSYIGRQPRLPQWRPGEKWDYYDHQMRKEQALENDVVENPRYNEAPQWIRDSSFGRNEWDRLVSDSAGLGKKRMKVLG